METMIHAILIAMFICLLTLSTTSGKCLRRSELHSRCRKSCNTDNDCKGGRKPKKCLCDGKCGLSCVKNGLKCPDAPWSRPVNGFMKMTGTSWDDKVTYSCRSGYTLFGPSEVRCSGIEKWTPWDQGIPECKRACPVPDQIRDGRLIGRNFEVGRTVRFICNPGYQLRGKTLIRCQRNLQWSDDTPTCSVKTCGVPVMPSNARMRNEQQQSYQYGDRVYVTCNPGYYRRGNPRKICSLNGWSETDVSCYAKSCGSPEVPRYGYKEGQSFTFRSITRFFCNPGYEIQGSSYRRCQANQKWSGVKSTCNPKDCGPSPNLANGIFTGFGTKYGAVHKAECNVGLILVGNADIRCGTDGKWQFQGDVQCIDKPKDCYSPPQPPGNGKILMIKRVYLHEDSVQYQCIQGHVSKDASAGQKCMNGLFVGKIPSCERDKRYIGCYKDGYNRVMIDSKSLSTKSINQCISLCQNAGKYYAGIEGGYDCRCGNVYYSNAHGKAKESECYKPCYDNRKTYCGGDYRMSVYKTGCTGPWPLAITNGNPKKKLYRVGDTAEYVCTRGHVLKGEFPVCQRNLRWSIKKPRCEKVTCGSLPYISNGKIKGRGFSYGTRRSISCNRGYKINMEPPTIQCNERGRWDGTEKKCIIERNLGDDNYCRRNHQCGVGEGDCDSDSECKSGLVCGSNNCRGRMFDRFDDCCVGSGHKATERPTPPPNPATERPIPPPNRGVSSRATNYMGCYKDRGESRAMSVSKLLIDLTPPTIQKCTAHCRQRYLYAGLQNGGECWCGDKYAIHGSSPENECNKSCLRSTKTRCGGVYRISVYRTGCSDPFTPVNGRVIKDSPNQRYNNGQVAKYECDKNYTLIGSQTCRNYKWEGDISCLKDCSKDIKSPTLEVISESNSHGSNGRFQCRVPFVINGNDKTKCQNGQWLGPLPSCRGPCKKIVSSSSNGYYSYSSMVYAHRSTATLLCNPGYEAKNGAKKLKCDDGQWKQESAGNCESTDKFICKNKKRILRSWKCDGADDCGDNSDEQECNGKTGSKNSDEFICRNMKRILTSWKCDGSDDCGDNSDEQQCDGKPTTKVSSKCKRCPSVPAGGSFVTLCKNHSTVFVGTVKRVKLGDKKIARIQTKSSLKTPSNIEMDVIFRPGFRWRQRIQTYEDPKCYCPHLETGKEYIFFIKDPQNLTWNSTLTIPADDMSTNKLLRLKTSCT